MGSELRPITRTRRGTDRTSHPTQLVRTSREHLGGGTMQELPRAGIAARAPSTLCQGMTAKRVPRIKVGQNVKQDKNTAGRGWRRTCRSKVRHGNRVGDGLWVRGCLREDGSRAILF